MMTHTSLRSIVARWLLAACLLVATTHCGGAGCDIGKSVENSSGGSSSSDGDGPDTSSIIVGLVILGGLTTVLLVMTTTDPEFLGRWLDRHERDVQLAIARGAGPFVDDLAHDFAIPPEHQARVGTALRDHHVVLTRTLAISDPAERAVAFFKAVGRAMADDPVLRGYLRAHPRVKAAEGS